MNTVPTSALRLHFRAQGESIAGPLRYGTGPCALGMLLAARSDRGICAIFLGDCIEQLSAHLVRAFPTTRIVHAQAALHADLGQIAAHIDRPGAGMRLDLDVGGTSFQQRVWRALCDIPAGTTSSYSELAQRIAAPAAVRAVAGACAANLLAIAIPCHRIVRRDGTLSGYRWGVERKRQLLRREGVR